MADTSKSEHLGPAASAGDTRYEDLVHRAGYGVYRSSTDGRFVEANAALATMLGYARVADLLAVDTSRDMLIDVSDSERLRQHVAGSDASDWIETRWRRRDGGPLTLRLLIRPVIGSSGAVEFYDGLVEDVTERRRNDEVLHRKERLATLGTTLAGVAHELNNPLAAIIGFSQLLLRKSWPIDDRAAIEAINHEALRSAAIVKDLLALAGRRDGERKRPTNVNDIIGYIVRTRRYSLETLGIGCVLDLDPGLPMVQGDRTQLEQVFLNLIANAEQALRSRVDADDLPAVAHLRIRTGRDAQNVVIEIEDDGPGVPDDAREHIWDPFWTTNSDDDRIGLGLAVVHGIVADHGGTVLLENAASSGARFVVRLPRATVDATPDPVSQASRPLDVLMVDPGAGDLLFIQRLLTSRGHAVIDAGSGELAVRLASQTTFDAVVCGACVLGPDEMPIVSALRATSGCKDARFVISTADVRESGSEPWTTENAAVISRPFDVEQLRRLIEGD